MEKRKYFFLLLLFLMTGCQFTNLVVHEVVSGDTIILKDGRKIRYAGVVLPKDGSIWKDLSQQANSYLVKDKVVVLVFEPDHSSKNDIYAFVYTPIMIDSQKKFLFVNAEMVRFGLLKALPPLPVSPNKEIWHSLWDLQEQEAKHLRKGIWSEGIP